ncbi:MAG: tetratricopeptide repeat protein [Deltaproteobacteria bacterium]|nr:tetratricopeptide repeat protein [Deltaproteobacteria bacterium]
MTLRSFVFAAVLAGLAGIAHAQTPAWSVGVTEAKKAEAKKFLDAGNALFLDKKYAEALESYKSAVGAWDHPAIRFNIVRCLIQLDRPVDASDNLKLALKYGAAPLEEAVYTEALAYDKLLSNQIGDLTMTCSQPEVRVTLDGQPLATCPAKESRRVAPGPHQVVATGKGLLTKTVEVVVIGGRSQEVAVKLDPLARAARVEHRWSQYVPWVVFGTGFAIAGIGAVLDLSAVADMDSYDRTVAQNCSVTACAEDDPRLAGVRDLKSSAETKSNIAVGVMIAGAATIATGAVMLYLNRGRTVYPESVERLTPSVTPMPGGATFNLTRGF